MTLSPDYHFAHCIAISEILLFLEDILSVSAALRNDPIRANREEQVKMYRSENQIQNSQFRIGKGSSEAILFFFINILG